MIPPVPRQPPLEVVQVQPTTQLQSYATTFNPTKAPTTNTHVPMKAISYLYGEPMIV